MPVYSFEVDLIFEPSLDSMTITVDYETVNPDGLIDGVWPDGFADHILQNISIVPLTYDVNEV